MSFLPSTDTNTNLSLFFINRSKVEERFDPEYYHPNHYADLVKLNASKYDLYPLNKICSRIVDGPFGSAIKAGDYVKEGVPFIRVADVTHGEGSIKMKGMIYISSEAHEKIKRSKVVPNDVVIAKTGATMGAASVVPESISEANIRGDLAALTTLIDVCLPEYLISYINTDIGQRLFWRLDSGGTRGRVVIGNLKKYPVLVPSIDKQREIIQFMNNAYSTKKQKEAEAQKLLDSIEDYLLEELGIDLPQQTENTTESRIFTRPFSELSGGRIDPFFSSLNKLDKSGSYDFIQLKKITDIRKGNSITSEQVEDGDVTVIAGGQTSPYNHNVANNNGDIITVSASGAYAGYVWYHENPVFASDCTMISSKDNEILTNQYLFEYLKAEQQEIYNLQQGSGQPHVYPSDLEKIKIPLPPKDKQIELVRHTNKIRQQAKVLQQEAKTDLEHAKKEVEAMILAQGVN